MKEKGHDDKSAKNICGKLQSETKGASITNELDALYSAISMKDCLEKAKSYGHDDDAAQRICDVVSNPKLDDTEDKIENSKKGADTFEQEKGTPLPYEDPSGTIDPSFTAPEDHDDSGAGGPTFDNVGADEAAMEDEPENYEVGNVGLEDNDHLDNQDEIGNMDDTSDKLMDMNDDDEEGDSMDEDVEKLLTDIDNVLGGAANDCISKALSDGLSVVDAHKKCISSNNNTPKDLKHGDPGSEFKNQYSGDLQFQNQPTSTGKLDDYLDSEAIDWHSDAEADYNEKSDTKKIDLSYYDDDINKCVDEQVKNGLSQENARTFCSNLANYNGDGDITPDDQQLPVKYENREYVTGSDTGSHEAGILAYNENDFKLLEAYFTREKESLVDPLSGGDADTPKFGRDTSNGGRHPDSGKYVEGHGENNLKSKPHSHDMSNDGPTYDQFGNAVVNEADTTVPDTYETDHNSNLDDNDHIATHMSKTQKQMGNQNLEQIPAEDDNESMQGLGQDSVGNVVNKGPSQAFNNGTNEQTAKPETVGTAPESAAIKKAWNESVNAEAIAATEKLNLISKILGAAKDEPHPKVLDNCVKIKMKADDKLSEEDATKACEKSLSGSIETINWTRSGTTYSAEQCEKDHGGDADAKSVCEYVAKHYNGSYDAYQKDMQIEPFESNNKLFVKAFLMDPSLNLNQWGVSPNTLDANIRTYIGKPLVLQQDFNHPVSLEDTLQHQLEYQELFRIGTIVDVVKKTSRYEAIAEVTDAYAQQAFKEGNLPLYVSPQLYKMDASEPDGQMTKWTGTHLCIVKEPAYGVKLATVNGECTGEADKCVSYLKKAAIVYKNGYGNCGFCNYKVLSSTRPKIIEQTIQI